MRYLFLVFAIIYGGLYLQISFGWPVFAIPILIASTGSVFFLFLDYHKKKNFHKAIIGLSVILILTYLMHFLASNGMGMILAGMIPLMLFGVLWLKNIK